MARGGHGLPARLARGVAWIEDALLVAMLAAMIVLGALQIVLRNVFASGLPWIDPILRLLVLWVAMLGALVATRQDKHITVDVVSHVLSPRRRAAVRVLTDLFAAVVSAVLAHAAFGMVRGERAADTAFVGALPIWLAQSILPFAFGVIALRFLFHAYRHAREAAARGGKRP